MQAEEKIEMDQVKIGIIGLGNMGSAHVVSLGELGNAKLTALCDTNPEKLKRYEGKGFQLFTEDEAFFQNADVDAVVVATPHYFHVPLVLRALECGKHALTEKPVSVHKQLAEQLLEAAKKYPHLKLAAMFNQRTIPAHKKIKELIESGELGEIRRVNWIITNWFRTQAYYDSGDWRASWRGEGGGVLLNQCPHQLDLMQWLFGMPEKVTATIALGKYHDIEVEDDVTAVLEYPNRATGVFIASTGEAPGTNRLEITAEHGRVVFEDGKLTYLRNEMETSRFCRESKEKFSCPPVWNVTIPVAAGNDHQHRDVLENFCDAILKDVPLIAPAVEGIRGLELGNAMLLSGLKHKIVELPMDAAEFAAELDKLVATSRYVKKVAATDETEDFSKSFRK